MILENRLAGVMGGKMAVGGLRAGAEPFIEQLAAPTATPGGGSASAAAAAMAAALGSMVAGMSRGKKAYLQYEQELSQAMAKLSQLREDLKAGIDADAESYSHVMAAYKQAKSSSDGGGEIAIQDALKGATSVPLQTALKAREVGDIVTSLKPITNPNMASDLAVAGALVSAAIVGALANVDINLGSIKDSDFVDEVRAKVAQLQR
jgi:formiminotetrahydrofolate cyclodeaminase